MALRLEPNKVKIAKRVIEILEFFSETNQSVTVMEIVRRYGHPQSSTTELLGNLTEMGILYKNTRTRSYSPTPRVAAFAISSPCGCGWNGRLFSVMQRLAARTGHGIALFGVVGLHVQIFHIVPGEECLPDSIHRGASEPLAASAAGMLLLSALPPDDAARLLWRARAQRPLADLGTATALEQIATLRETHDITGSAAGDAELRISLRLLSARPVAKPLALGALYPTHRMGDETRLAAMLAQAATALMTD